LELFEERRPWEERRDALLILVRSSFNYYFIFGVIRLLLLLIELLLVYCPPWLRFFRFPSVPIFRHSLVFSFNFLISNFS
jgi:hypothetical protein